MQNNGQVCFNRFLIKQFLIYDIFQVKIQTDDMELAGIIIHSLGKFLKIDELQTVCDFPLEFELLQQVFSQV